MKKKRNLSATHSIPLSTTASVTAALCCSPWQCKVNIIYHLFIIYSFIIYSCVVPLGNARSQLVDENPSLFRSVVFEKKFEVCRVSLLASISLAVNLVN